MSNFKVGDTVKLIGNSLQSRLSINDVGTIVLIDSDKTCRVNTDKYTDGNWVKLSDLELITKDIKMKKIYIEVEDGYEVDTINSTPTCIKFKKEEKKQVTCWEDLSTISGYYTDSDADIFSLSGYTPEDSIKNLFATKEQAEACIALAMLSQLMKDVNKDWIPDWTTEDPKYIIRFVENSIETDWFTNLHFFFIFPNSKS